MYKMCLVSNRPATSSSTLGIIIPKVTGQSQLSCSLGLWQSAQAVRRVRCAFWYKKNNLTRHRLNLWHLSARTASFTTLLNIRNDCLQSMCTVKKTIFLPVYCILRLSLSTPVLNFPSRISLRSVICWIGPGSSGFLCFIIYTLAGLRVYIWRRNEPPRCPVLFLRETGWTAAQSVWRSPSLPTTVASETFVIRSTFSVFNLKFLRSVFWISKNLYCQVLWFGVFYTLDMNLTQLLLLSL